MQVVHAPRRSDILFKYKQTIRISKLFLALHNILFNSVKKQQYYWKKTSGSCLLELIKNMGVNITTYILWGTPYNCINYMFSTLLESTANKNHIGSMAKTMFLSRWSSGWIPSPGFLKFVNKISKGQSYSRLTSWPMLKICCIQVPVYQSLQQPSFMFDIAKDVGYLIV